MAEENKNLVSVAFENSSLLSKALLYKLQKPLSHLSNFSKSIVSSSSSYPLEFMENLIGLLRIHIKRGVNLAIRDISSSDPYVVVQFGKQKLKSRVVKHNINPEWNDSLTLSVTDPNLPVKLMVYDHDLFSADDKMGQAEFHIGPFIEAIKIRKQLAGPLPNGTIIMKIQPSRENYLSEESCIVWNQGQIVQNLFLRLRDVERGEVEIQLEWIDVPGSRGI